MFVTSYFYCHYEGQGTNTAVDILRGLVYQLLNQYPQLLPHCHAKYQSSGGPTLRSPMLARKLFEDFCHTVPKLYVIVDGLDECEQTERKQLLGCFVETIGQCDIAELGKLRILIVSQAYPDIGRALHSSSIKRTVPSTFNISSTDNQRDIQTYVKSRVDRIAGEFELSNDLSEYLRNLTVERAKGKMFLSKIKDTADNDKGMFLYAKLVMENLEAQPTRNDLLDAIKQENFPDGLKEA